MRDTFSCLKCGHCCRPHGFVRLRDRDVDRLASALDLSLAAFTERYTDLAPGRAFLTLKENEDGSCVFLDPAGECRVYEGRPGQCRDFPVRWNTPGFREWCRASGGPSPCP